MACTAPPSTNSAYFVEGKTIAKKLGLLSNYDRYHQSEHHWGKLMGWAMVVWNWPFSFFTKVGSVYWQSKFGLTHSLLNYFFIFSPNLFHNKGNFTGDIIINIEGYIFFSFSSDCASYHTGMNWTVMSNEIISGSAWPVTTE